MKQHVWGTMVRWGYRGALAAVVLVSAFAAGSFLLQFVSNLFGGQGGLSAVRLPGLDAGAIYNATVSFLVVAVPVVLSWYARNYLRSADSQKRIAVIASLADAAINYAEDCDRRGDRELAYSELDLPESMARTSSPGQQKLCLASDWLIQELDRMGIKRVSLDEAAKWVAAQYQRSVGNLRSVKSLTQLTDSAADLLSQLGRTGQITLPANTLEAVTLIQSIADWAAKQVDAGGDKSLQRELAMARISPRTLMANGASGRAAGKITAEVRLSMLAQRAVEYVADLQRQGKLRLPERDTARAWLFQQTQQDDVVATPEQIEKALAAAFDQRPA